MQKFNNFRLPSNVLLLACWLIVASGPAASDDLESQAQPASSMVVHKSPFCLCCKEWMKHLEKNAFTVTADNSLGMPGIKEKLGVPRSMQGCHTAVWQDKYVFEGHVPARLIRRFLANPPKNSIGLAAPGMPRGTPGMYRGEDFEPYNVFVLFPGEDYQLYETVTAPEEE